MDTVEEQELKVSRKPNKIITYIVIALALFGAFRFGYVEGSKGNLSGASTYTNSAKPDVDYNLLWQAINAVNEKYIDKPVDQQKVLYGAIKGAVSAAGDQYTEFFTPEDLEGFRTDLKGSFDGIGAEIGKRNDAIAVVAPLDGSPAKKAGLLAKDIIIKVNGEETANWSVEEAVKKIRGPKGSEVTLTIFREDKTQPFDVKIVRETIEVKSVKWEVKEQKDASGAVKKVGVITLSRFGDDTKPLFAQAVKDLSSKQLHGLVLDLRNNPGGYLDGAIDVASYFVRAGDMVVTEATVSEKSEERSYGYRGIPHNKLAVLINGGSASASEILAGAIQDHKLGTLIGEKSFGKGSVQQVVELPGNSAVKVTVAKWITPGGKNLNKDGLVPDIEVKLSDEDINAQKDPQMDRALQEAAK